MVILFSINLLNFMDRYIIAGIHKKQMKRSYMPFVIFLYVYSYIGVLDQVLTDFNISDALGGLLQTAFICSYMALAPIFGYLG